MNCKRLRALLFAFLLAFCSLSISAQNSELKWGLGFHGAILEANTTMGNNFLDFKVNDNTFGLGLSISRYLNRSFDLGLYATQARLSQSYNSFFYDDPAFFADFRLRYKFNNGYMLKEDALFQPYLSGGVGATHFNVEANGWDEDAKDELKIDEGRTGLDLYAGLGIRFRINDFVSINWETGIHFPTEGEMDADKNNFISSSDGADTRDGLLAGDKDKIMEHSLGLIVNLGKLKDSDNDGVADKYDKCPNTPAGVKVDEAGCPLDQDKDGVADYLDECPAMAGVPALKGCPDKDADGIADKEDRCPDVAGLMTLQGCPDADADGVADMDDKCPGTKAGYKVDATGCPMDGDGDGVINEEDDCPTLKGLPYLKGCPDGDNDGIADKDDRCPNERGVAANKGCPEVPKEVLVQVNKIAEKIFFETGSDKLKGMSASRLDDLAGILKQYPSAKLTIEGHTDNTGDPQKNMVLSQKRCDSVKNYLSSKGVDPNRMTATGYGDTRPVADNKTSDGRAKNRRVELKMEY